MVLVELVLPDIRTYAYPNMSSGSSSTYGSIGGGDEGRVMRGGNCDDEQGLTLGNSRPCISMVISSLLVLFLNHLI